MKNFICLGIVWGISVSGLVANASYSLVSDKACLEISDDRLSLSQSTVLYTTSQPVILEVNGETLSGRYKTVTPKDGQVICRAKLTSQNGSVFEVEDIFSKDIAGHFLLDREVSVVKARREDHYFNSYFGLCNTLVNKVEENEYFVPGIWYKDNQCLRAGSLASDYTDNYFYFREDRLPLPVVSAKVQSTRLSVDLMHVGANPVSFYGENGVGRIVDERMQFGSLGFVQAKGQSIMFVFPGIEGEKSYTGRFPHNRTKGFSYRSHPVKKGIEHAYQLRFGFNEVADFPDMVDKVWEQSWNQYNPRVQKVDIDDAYRASIEVLDAYLLNLNGAPGWPFSIYLPNGLARAYNYQMGFIGFQLSNAYFLLRNGLENNREEYVEDGCSVIDFWVENSQMENGLLRTWADAYVDRKHTWRDYETSMRVTAGGMEGLMGAWSVMKKYGRERPQWLQYCRRYADWLGANQNADGSFYLSYDWKTGAPIRKSPYTTSNIIRFLIELYVVTGDEDYFATAMKAGEFCYREVHEAYRYVGGVVDNPNVKDRESGQLAIYAFLALYDMTGDEKWKAAALQAARYTETFMFSYQVPMSLGAYLTDFPPSATVIGQTLIATGHSGIDNGMAFSSFQYYRLYLLTGDKHWLDVARVIQNNTLSIMDLQGRMGYKYRGLLTECFNPQANRGHSVRQQLPWNQASILEPMHRFKDAFGLIDIDEIEKLPMEERQQRIKNYAETQGLIRE